MLCFFFFFFFNDTATTEIYTLSLHDALPISLQRSARGRSAGSDGPDGAGGGVLAKSETRRRADGRAAGPRSRARPILCIENRGGRLRRARRARARIPLREAPPGCKQAAGGTERLAHPRGPGLAARRSPPEGARAP